MRPNILSCVRHSIQVIAVLGGIFLPTAPTADATLIGGQERAGESGWTATVRKRLSERDYPEAVHTLKERLPGREKDFAFLNLLGTTLDRAGKTEEAAGYYGEALAVRPQSTTVRINLALNLVRQGKYGEAAAEFTRILKEDRVQATREPPYQQAPDDETMGAFVKAVPARERDWYELGLMLLRHGRTLGAQAVFGGAALAYPDSALLHYAGGWAAQEGGRFEEARKAFARALELRPEFPEALTRLGYSYFVQGDYEGAVRSYGKLLEIAPESYEGHYFLAQALIKRGPGEYDSALEHLRKAVSLNPLSFDSLVEMGRIHLQRGKLAEAREALETARRLNGNLEKAHYLLAQVYARLGNAAMAEQARASLEDVKRLERARAREMMDGDLFWVSGSDPSELATKVAGFFEAFRSAVLAGEYRRVWNWLTPESRELYDGDPGQFARIAARVFDSGAVRERLRRSRAEGGKIVAGRILLEFAADKGVSKMPPLVLVEQGGEVRIDYAFEWTTAGLGYLGAR